MEYEAAAAAWAAKQQELLKLELIEEETRTTGALAMLSVAELEAQGSTLARAIMGGPVVGSFGRTMVALDAPKMPKPSRAEASSRRRHRDVFPPHRMRPGTLVGVCLARDEATARSARHEVRGVVSRSGDSRVTIVLDDERDGGDGPEAMRRQAQVEAVLRPGAVVRCDTVGSTISGDRLSRAVADVGASRWWAADAVGRALFEPVEGDEADSSEDIYGDAAASRTRPEGATWPDFDWDTCVPPAGAAAPPPPARGAAVPLAGETPVPALAADGVASGLFRRDLNGPQVLAVARCVASSDVHLVHGPPGTGKTTTVVEIVRQLVARGLRVLACAPSNVAVDNLAERLVEPADGEGPAAAGLPAAARGAAPVVVRLGHPARVSDSLQGVTLDARLEAGAADSGVKEARRTMEREQRRSKKAKTGPERYEARQAAREAAKEARTRERRAAGAILRGADVVMSTLSGAASAALWTAVRDARGDAVAPGAAGSGAAAAEARASGAVAATAAAGAAAGSSMCWFDVVVIDEAAQATEASCWIAARLGRRLLLAGDHLQLPPTVLSDEAAKQGLAVTLPQRLVRLAGSSAVSLLRVQHRMCLPIGGWASAATYSGRLEAHESVARRCALDLPGAAAAVAGLRAAEEAEEEAGWEGEAPATTVPWWMREPGALDSAELEEWLGCGLVHIDTAGCDGYGDDTMAAKAARAEAEAAAAAAGLSPEQTEAAVRFAGAESRSNPGEAALAAASAAWLVAAGGVPGAGLVVISPYNGQVARIRAALEAAGSLLPAAAAEALSQVRVSTVDSFQGQEAECVVLSLVRSNEIGEVGFLADSRRINVAVTRAKRLCVVIGDSDTAGRDPFLAGLMRHTAELADATAAGGGWRACLGRRDDVAAAAAGSDAASPFIGPGGAVRSASMFDSARAAVDEASGDDVIPRARGAAASGSSARRQALAPKRQSSRPSTATADPLSKAGELWADAVVAAFLRQTMLSRARMAISGAEDMAGAATEVADAVDRAGATSRGRLPRSVQSRVRSVPVPTSRLPRRGSSALDLTWPGAEGASRCACLELSDGLSAAGRRAAHMAAEESGALHFTVDAEPEELRAAEALEGRADHASAKWGRRRVLVFSVFPDSRRAADASAAAQLAAGATSVEPAVASRGSLFGDASTVAEAASGDGLPARKAPRGRGGDEADPAAVPDDDVVNAAREAAGAGAAEDADGRAPATGEGGPEGGRVAGDATAATERDTAAAGEDDGPGGNDAESGAGAGAAAEEVDGAGDGAESPAAAEAEPEDVTLEVILARSPVTVTRAELRLLPARDRIAAMKASRDAAKAGIDAKGGYAGMRKEVTAERRRAKRSDKKQTKKKAAAAATARAAAPAKAGQRLGSAPAAADSLRAARGLASPSDSMRAARAKAIEDQRARLAAGSGAARPGKGARASGDDRPMLPTYEDGLKAVRERRRAEGRAAGTESEEDEAVAEVAKLTDALMRRVGRGGAILRMPDGRSVAGHVAEGSMLERVEGGMTDAAREGGQLRDWKRRLVSRQLRERLEGARAGRVRGAKDEDGDGKAAGRGAGRKKR